MAMACTSPSGFLAPKPCGTPPKVTPFLGFPLASSSSKPSVPTTPLSRTFQIRCCQERESVYVPSNQRWMFDESQLTGIDVWNKTWYPKAADFVNTSKPWYIVDATDKILGRLASTIAIHIRGKDLATFTPSCDMGAFVIVLRTFSKNLLRMFPAHETVVSIPPFFGIDTEILRRGLGRAWPPKLDLEVNAEKVAVSGKKRTQKLYRRHSGRPGGMTVETFDQLQKRIPERIVEHAVRGMLPKGRLGRSLFNHLKVYTGPNHPHDAQQPIDLPIRDKRIQKQR